MELNFAAQTCIWYIHSITCHNLGYTWDIWKHWRPCGVTWDVVPEQSWE